MEVNQLAMDINLALNTIDNMMEHYRKLVAFWDGSNESERETMRSCYDKLAVANSQHIEQMVETSKEILEQEKATW